MRSIKSKSKAILIVVWLSISFQCTERQVQEQDSYDLLSEEEKREAKNALSALIVEDDLEVSLFASEPMMSNPTNIDIDHRGRVWICEGYNYRADIVGNTPREEGDRILILEDTDGDGKADKQTVFYQDKELDSPLGILVLGNRVIVSQSPYIWMLTDEDGDDKADKKEIIFQGIEGVEHDHGVHAVVFGPDGRFYFNFGNYGKQLLDRNGNPVRDPKGEIIDFNNYKEGIVFRCDENFENIEVLGDNFRNPYEVALDSYGTIWQSDNDDDGNKGVRMNYVMQGGNFGFKDEMTGASWQVPRTNMEDSIPYRHWFQNDPGVIPNLLHTGAGSPTGLTVYEGTLLPERFRNQLIHCDAGQNTIRAYPVEKSGAGYKAGFAPILRSEKDQWFRPTDVSVAPDGSIIGSDWYDPSVGGHQIGDQERGRLYRIAPPDSPYIIPTFDFSTPEGAIEALKNPNLAARYLAWQALYEMGRDAEEALASMVVSKNVDPRMKARCLWILGKLEVGGEKYIKIAAKDDDPDIRVVAVRMMERAGEDVLMNYLPRMANDPDAQVRREIALTLRNISANQAAPIWVQLALAHDGNDRWYLEALGIGAENKWDILMEEWLRKQEGKISVDSAAKDIVWRSRSKFTLPILADLAADPVYPMEDRLRYFRAFDFYSETKEKDKVLMDLLVKGSGNKDNELVKWGLKHLNPSLYRTSTDAYKIVRSRLNQIYGTAEFVDLIQRYNISDQNDRLMSMILESIEVDLGKKSAAIILNDEGVGRFEKVVRSGDMGAISALLSSIGENRSNEVMEILTIIATKESLDEPIRREALKFMTGSNAGQDKLLNLLAQNQVSGELRLATARSLMGANRESVKLEAAKHLDQNFLIESSHPPISKLITKTGDALRGKEVFANYCALCHTVNGIGDDFGPDLSGIGKKLPKEGMYTAIFKPSAGISFGYEGYNITLKDGLTVTGIVTNRTDEELTLAFPGGNSSSYDMSEVISLKQIDESLMPSGLQNGMTTQELVDLIEYLINLE